MQTVFELFSQLLSIFIFFTLPIFIGPIVIFTCLMLIRKLLHKKISTLFVVSLCTFAFLLSIIIYLYFALKNFTTFRFWNSCGWKILVLRNLLPEPHSKEIKFIVSFEVIWKRLVRHHVPNHPSAGRWFEPSQLCEVSSITEDASWDQNREALLIVLFEISKYPQRASLSLGPQRCRELLTLLQE